MADTRIHALKTFSNQANSDDNHAKPSWDSEMNLLTSIDLSGIQSGDPGKNQNSLLMLDLKNLRDVIFVQDMNLKIIYASPSALSVFGYAAEEINGFEVQRLMTPDSFARGLESLQKHCLLAQEKTDIDIPLMEYEYIRKDGSTFWGELKVNFIWDPNGNLIGCQGILRDVDERKRMEKNLQQSKNRFRTLFDLSPQAISLTEMATGRFVDVNENFCRLTQYHKDEVIGKTPIDMRFYSDKNRETFIRELQRSGEVRSLEMDFRIKNGSVLNTQIFAKIVEVENARLILSVFYNKTHEKRLERQFLQAQKMESIGTVAGSIAHDFNNFLMGIEGYATLMSLNTDTSHPHHPMLCAIHEQVQHCRQLTKQLLGYARSRTYQVAPFNLNHLIEETISSLKGATKHLAVQKKIDPELLSVNGDAVQIKQLLYNLYINAVDAMPKGGELFLKTANVNYEEMTGRAYKPKKIKYVSIIVSDTGIGMDQNTLDHLFEPFFTTKEDGKGTGLGLASVYGIVKGHDGYIDVESKPGKGTTFSIYLPASIQDQGPSSK